MGIQESKGICNAANGQSRPHGSTRGVAVLPEDNAKQLARNSTKMKTSCSLSQPSWSPYCHAQSSHWIHDQGGVQPKASCQRVFFCLGGLDLQTSNSVW